MKGKHRHCGLDPQSPVRKSINMGLRVKPAMTVLFIGITFAVFPFVAMAQESEIIENIIEQMAENQEEEEMDFSILEDQLQQFSDNPIDLNHTTREELEQLPFLSENQVENLLYYLYRYAPMYSVYELQMVEGFDRETIENLLPFVVVNKEVTERRYTFPQLLKGGKHQFLSQTRGTLEQKRGYENGNYLGEPFYQSLRYNFQSKNKLFFGITAEKDEGEPFWTEKHKGFDFYSAHFQMNNVWKFKRIIVGDFRAGFGYGLVLNNNFSMGKSSYVLNVLPTAKGLMKTSSTNEYNFFRGAGATVKLGKFEFSGFYSYRNLDGSLGDDGSFSSLKTDGLHRTQSDWDKRQNIAQQVIGSNLSFNYRDLILGATFASTHFNHAWLPEPAPYRLYYFRGTEQMAGSINYRYSWRKIRFFGETAIDDTKSVATLNGLSFTPLTRVSFLVLQRYYDKGYQAIFANSFAENSRIGNEQGVYIGTEIRPFKYWKLSAYTDVFRFPYLKYGTDTPSDGYDVMLQADYAPKRNVNMYLRYRYKQKEKNVLFDVTNSVEEYDKATVRYVLKYRLNSTVQLQNIIEYNRTETGGQAATKGFLLAQDVTLSWRNPKLKTSFRYAFFDTESYDNRIYAYEKDVLYAFSIPMYYGTGSRFYANLNYTLNKHFSLWFKIAHTRYHQRESIGSGNELINGNRKTDLKLMLRYVI
ncbi:hypothetical protein FACS189434_08870 [Bacteroidia bacterium]|nr:hypothetical protein FACS189434_08870 [Bacteroidia bacterium]